MPNWRTGRIQICHACEHHSNNGWCENPLHLSVGTVTENHSDMSLETKQKSGRKAVELKTGMFAPSVAQKNYQRQRKTVEVTNLTTGETQTFKGLRVAARELGLRYCSLSQVCNGKLRTTEGYTARYV